MKKIFSIVLILSCFFSAAQETEAPRLDTLTTEFQVLNIFGDQAQIMTSSLSRKYQISLTPEINPFGYQLMVDREYTIQIERDMTLVDEYHSRGQTKTLPARLIWFAPSELQLKRDKLFMNRFTDREPVSKD